MSKSEVTNQTSRGKLPISDSQADITAWDYSEEVKLILRIIDRLLQNPLQDTEHFNRLNLMFSMLEMQTHPEIVMKVVPNADQ